jgi:hypothetical protein
MHYRLELEAESARHDQSRVRQSVWQLRAAFIDFKQAYDTIPRDALWKHLKRTHMPAPLLPVIQDMYNRDEYVLKDGDKTARVHPTRGVKQARLPPISFAFFPL